MSEQEQKHTSFMQELDQWTAASVISPLYVAAVDFGFDEPEPWEDASERVMKAIRAKVLESFHNGQRMPARPQRGGRYGR